MTQLERLKIRLPEEKDEAVLNEYLLAAADMITTRRFPFDEPPLEVETRYLGVQIDIAAELYARRGAEGETQHIENGTTRTYANSAVSESLLAKIVPKGKVL